MSYHFVNQGKARSDRVVAGSEGDWAWLAGHGGHVRRISSDAADVRAVHKAVCMLGSGGLRLSGIFHAAHQLADAAISNQSAVSFRTTYGPKVHGACSLHGASWHAPLRQEGAPPFWTPS